jgi:hypothetical protein
MAQCTYQIALHTEGSDPMRVYSPVLLCIGKKDTSSGHLDRALGIQLPNTTYNTLSHPIATARRNNSALSQWHLMITIEIASTTLAYQPVRPPVDIADPETLTGDGLGNLL